MYLTRWAVVTAVLAIAGETRADVKETPSVTNERGFLDRTFIDESGAHKYVVFVPHAYDPSKTWPTILFLHGAGQRGDDGKKQATVGLGRAIRKDEKSFGFLVVFPQCENMSNNVGGHWRPDKPDGKRALGMLAELEKNYRVDPDRVYLTGLSMGGFGVWSHASTDPRRWAAIVPICGGGRTEWASALAPIPCWCFHGGADRTVPVQLSRMMIEALKNAGGSPKYTELDGVGHNSWDAAYGDPLLFAWMLQQKRINK